MLAVKMCNSLKVGDSLAQIDGRLAGTVHTKGTLVIRDRAVVDAKTCCGIVYYCQHFVQPARRTHCLYARGRLPGFHAHKNGFSGAGKLCAGQSGPAAFDGGHRLEKRISVGLEEGEHE